MRRRSFLKNMLPMVAAPFAINGIPVRAMANSLLSQSFTCEEINNRVIVMIQLHGGNDGLNTLIPLDQYATYKNLRPLIGILDHGPRKYIDLDGTQPSAKRIGLHPDLVGLKSLYDEGKVNFVQDVSYPNNNGSHFRSTDIWLSGKDGTTSQEIFDSGWFGRYLDHRFPKYPEDYPNSDLPDPPGLEFGNCIVSLGFHRQVGIPMGIALSEDPADFFNLVSGVGGPLPTNIPNSHFGTELQYILDVERSTNSYAQRLTNLFNQGANTPGVVYPQTYHTNAANHYNNPLSDQLQTVARLLAGGITTKVFLVRMGGFDTHGEQALAGKPSYGGHGALLYHLAGAIKAFQDDLAGLGLEDRVLTMTFSEFGRQVAENGTLGTDHGTSAPMIIVGKGIKPGITGNNPNLSQVHNNKFTSFQYDYRQVFTTVLQDWLGANNGTLQEAEFLNFSNQKLDLINDNFLDNTGTVINYIADLSCDDTPPPPPPPPTALDPDTTKPLFNMYPNPATDKLFISLESKQMAPAAVQIFDKGGRMVKSVSISLYAGENLATVNLQGLNQGMYLVKVRTNPGSLVGQELAARKLVIR